MTRCILSRSEAETMQLAAAIAQYLKPGDLITLDGPLGSGKTCFVRGLARGLGIDPADVSSPTFIIRQTYGHPPGPTLTHLDAYRLSGEGELETIGFDELIESQQSIIALEWPSRIVSAIAGLPQLEVTFEHIAPNQREITLQVHGELAQRLEELDVGQT